MSDARDRLERLLDGNVEAYDIAEDASLVSLADRLYGIKIANVKPTKARDMIAVDGESTPVEPKFGKTSNLMVEVISSPTASLPELPHLQMPDLPNKKSKLSFLTIFSVTGFITVILNLLGLFSSLFEGICDTKTCRGSEQTRINLADFYKIGESDGWSYSLLSESMSNLGGTTGGIGIPDMIALIGLFGILIYSIKKK